MPIAREHNGPPRVDSVDLAKFVLAKLGPMPHLKLQKLLYYIEAWHLVYFEGESIIDDSFKAWIHGPVTTKVWHEFKDTNQTLLNSISVPQDGEAIVQKLSGLRGSLLPDQISLIEDVLNEYGGLTAYELEGLTHSEKPWIEARGETPPDEASSATISKRTMREFYHERLYGSSLDAE
jgi:uncharacterized phage-associated protein